MLVPMLDVIEGGMAIAKMRQIFATCWIAVKHLSALIAREDDEVAVDH
jgi:hypothetical protein